CLSQRINLCSLNKKWDAPIAISSPIPDLLVKLFNSKFPNKISSKLELKLLHSENQTSIQQLIDSLRTNPIPDEILQSLIEVLAQILMPLGQYSNLSEAVEQGIEKILDLITGKQDNYQEMRGLIRETIEEYNFGMARNYSLMMELNLQDLILTALQRFITEAEQPTIENLTQENKGELQDTRLYENLRIEKKSPGTQTQKPIKKPLFKITNIEPTSSKEINGNQPNLGNTLLSRSKTASQQKNSLQFPLCSQLRKQIKAKALENQECNDKSIFLSLPEFVDLTYWCSPVEDQGLLNSCTAHAGVALMEYAEKKSSDTYTDASPLFLYRVTRNLMQREGDSGASVRDTIKAMVAFGVCPEEHWPYNEDRFDQEPTPFCYSFAENYKTIKYFRLDYGQISRYTLLSQVKVLLASEIPCIFGFTLYNSVYDEVNVLKGHIPLPNKRSKVIGGHTVVAVGYHDRKIIENEDGKTSKGALLIRNSWGTRWGQGGYGWLPYDYIMEGLTADWWSLLKAEWLATGRFGAGASAWNPDKGDRDGDIKEGQTD
ncbi:MAG: C1 family peptidase, partial [Aulosira sp. ZfuVER01]|nr:C1 family peptidase [Aulosira sp. ZfuVER01]MDZ8056272.1 C1 family peptidase [Aulosira sp. ZfuCHP01]